MSGTLINRRSFKMSCFALLNLLAILIVHRLSDLPTLMKNWEASAEALSRLHLPLDNFSPPGPALLLVPFVWSGLNLDLAIVFFFTVSSLLYFLICDSVISDSKYRLIALAAFTLNPYLTWTSNSGLDTVFELFLMLAFAALLIGKRKGLAFLPLYLLCLVRPEYWITFFTYSIVSALLGLRGYRARRLRRAFLIATIALTSTLILNFSAFGSFNLAGKSGMTAHFAHNKFYYLAMPKFDMDVFLSTGGNMDTDKLLQNNNHFQYVKDKEWRAALISIVENPKSVFMNTLQKIDSYFFSLQKTPQLPGAYYLSDDQHSIIIGDERLSWFLILGNGLYFIYRANLLVFGFIAVAIFFVILRKQKVKLPQRLGFLVIPYFAGSVSGIIFYTESRFKVVSELLLVPVIVGIFDKYRSHLKV